MFRLLFFTISILLVTTNSYAKPPEWFGNLTVENNTVIGYGSGKSRKAAMVNARGDIAASINVKVTSQYNQTQELKNNEYKNEITNKTSEEVDVRLNGLKTLKSTESDGVHYVALSFDARSLTVKLREMFVNGVKFSHIESTNPYAHTLFASELKGAISSGITYTPEYDIVWNNGAYKLIINNNEFFLTANDVQKFLISHKNKVISIDLMHHTRSGYKSIEKIKAGDYFHINVKHASSGYLTLLNIDEEGKVSVMFDNKRVGDVTTETYPNLDEYEGLMTEVLNNKDSAIESYVAVLCSKTKRFLEFKEISESVNTDNNSLRFPALYKKIAGCDFASSLLKTRR